MKKINQYRPKSFLILGFLFLISSCSSIPRFQLTYRLPAEQITLAGNKVYVTLEDMREDKRIFGEGAHRKFKNIPESISFYIALGSAPGTGKGIYQPPDLLKKALESRLKHEGIEVVPEGAAPIRMSVLLKTFFMDRKDWIWKVTISYEARLAIEGKVRASEFVSAEAERFELVGKEQAEAMLGELLTDVVNRLNLNRLFQESKL
ncbi:MAG TPA: hypothetical protein ENI07_21780 [Desulfobacterales bacterium]|nr:hypothetical protein [Desulfobacterales bacterium]